jgi:hypothetical protein
LTESLNVFTEDGEIACRERRSGLVLPGLVSELDDLRKRWSVHDGKVPAFALEESVHEM